MEEIEEFEIEGTAGLEKAICTEDSFWYAVKLVGLFSPGLVSDKALN